MRLKKKSFRSVLQKRLRQQRIPFGANHKYRGEYNLLTKLQGHNINNATIRGPRGSVHAATVTEGMAAIEALRTGFWDVVKAKLSSVMVVIPGPKVHNMFVFTGPVNMGRVLGQYIVVEPRRPPVEVDRDEVDQPFDFVEMRFGARVSDASRVVALDTRNRTKVLYSRATRLTAYSRDTLQQMAEALSISGRARMTKAQLELAIANRRRQVAFNFPKPERYIETSNSFFASNSNVGSTNSARVAQRIAEQRAYHNKQGLPFTAANENFIRKSVQQAKNNFFAQDKARRKRFQNALYPPDRTAAILKELKNNGAGSALGSTSSSDWSRPTSRSTASGPSARSPTKSPARSPRKSPTRSPARSPKPRRRIVPTPVFVAPASFAPPASPPKSRRRISPTRVNTPNEVINLTGLRNSPRRLSPRRRSPNVINLT
jgi:hypothetical protein